MKIRNYVHLLFFLYLILFSFNLDAQVASSSLFKEMRSINPAVISLRPNAVVSIVASIDKIEKTQDISSHFGEGALNNSKINVQSGNMFYGGNGPGITNEVLLEYAKGKKEDILDSDVQTVQTSNDVTSMYGNWGIGFCKYLGASFGYMKYDYKDKFSGTFLDNTFSSDIEMESTAQLIKIGGRIKLLLDIGAFYEKLKYKSDRKISGIDSSMEATLDTAGAGVGFTTKKVHMEVSYERRLDSEEFDGKKYTADRIVGAVELNFGKLALGYTARYYRKGYYSMEGLLYNTLVYANTYDDPRLEHIFNFSFGSDKGHAISGSAYYSKTTTQEDMSSIITNSKFDTDIKAMGISVKYLYVF